jgi:uncharacterized small protein (DUF1192 family)
MRPNLGIAVDPDTAEIVTVKAGSIAERGGLLVGDVILDLDGQAPMAFLASAWWPRAGKPVLAKLQRGERVIWRVLIFDDAEPVALSSANPSPLDSVDPFRGMFQGAQHGAAAEHDDVAAAGQDDVDGAGHDRIATLRAELARLRARRIERAAAPKVKVPPLPQPGDETELVHRHLYAVGPLREGDRVRNNGPAERLWLERHGRTGRQAPR